MSNDRPAGVGFISWLLIIGGTINVVAGVLMLLHRGQAFIDALDISDGNVTSYAIGTIAVGAVVLLVAFSLRGGSNFARILLVGVWLANAAILLWGIFGLHSVHWTNALWPLLIISLAVGYLMFDEDSKAFFSGTRA
jgi:hypothetical protein